MIKLPGVLHIRMITGRNGDFRVGRLVTELGEFAVKDAELDQYEEGRYEGDFGISQIFPSYYSTGGRLVVEVRAKLNLIALASMAEAESVDAGLEQDPLDEHLATGVIATSSRPADDADAVASLGSLDTDADPDAQLFGLLWPLANPLKLDPTVDRNLFRQQRDRLKALGYQFQAIGQQWQKP